MMILVAGATGNLGGRIVRELRKRGADVRALVRPSSDGRKVDELKQQGVQIAEADSSDLAQLTTACEGVGCVVSSLQGLHDVIVDTQLRLVDAAVAAGVPRFIASDFSSDFTQQPDGENRNFDLRRDFMRQVDTKAIATTSILNGAFADLLLYGMPLLDFKQKQIGYWENPDWRIDFTTMDSTAAYTAAAALDESTPRILRIADFQISPNELAAVAEAAMGEPLRWSVWVRWTNWRRITNGSGRPIPKVSRPCFPAGNKASTCRACSAYSINRSITIGTRIFSGLARRAYWRNVGSNEFRPARTSERSGRDVETSVANVLIVSKNCCIT